MLLEYDSSLTVLARALRSRQTPSERRLWNVLRKKQLLGYRFIRQQPIASYIADFYCPKLHLAIEIDGEIHDFQKEYDGYRTKELNGMNVTVIRYANVQIQTELPRVLIHLKKIIHAIASSPLR